MKGEGKRVWKDLNVEVKPKRKKNGRDWSFYTQSGRIALFFPFFTVTKSKTEGRKAVNKRPLRGSRDVIELNVYALNTQKPYFRPFVVEGQPRGKEGKGKNNKGSSPWHNHGRLLATTATITTRQVRSSLFFAAFFNESFVILSARMREKKSNGQACLIV